jgi:type II secretory pathway component GspD/PulD (secretin)
MWRIFCESRPTLINNSAFQLALSDTDNPIRLSVGGFNAALAALNSDSRFRVLRSPNLRVRSGDTASLNVGESVPVIGAVSFPSSTAAPVDLRWGA